jgi:hypothetical protein
MEGHLLIATLAQRARFFLDPRQVIAPDLTKTLALRPYGKVEALIKRRWGKKKGKGIASPCTPC